MASKTKEDKYNKILKQAQKNTVAISTSDEFSHSGEGKQFWFADLKSVRPIMVDVKHKKNDEEVLYLVTSAVEGAERTTRIMLGDLYDNVQTMTEGETICVMVVDRVINPELTLQDVDDFAKYLKDNEDPSDPFVDRFRSVRDAINSHAAGKPKKALLFQSEVTIDD